MNILNDFKFIDKVSYLYIGNKYYRYSYVKDTTDKVILKPSIIEVHTNDINKQREVLEKFLTSYAEETFSFIVKNLSANLGNNITKIVIKEYKNRLGKFDSKKNIIYLNINLIQYSFNFVSSIVRYLLVSSFSKSKNVFAFYDVNYDKLMSEVKTININELLRI